MRGLSKCVFALAVICLGLDSTSFGSSLDSVLVVANGGHPWSARVAATYLAARGLQPGQVLTVDVPSAPVVSREVYQRAIERPVAEWLRKTQAIDRTRYIVLAPGLPLRIAGTVGRSGNAASVDSELALLYRRLTGGATPLSGGIDNPYFSATPADIRPFARSRHDIYLVTRLDGRTEQDALALITRGAMRPGTPIVVVDGRPREASGAEGGWLEEVGPRVQAARSDARVVADATSEVVRGVPGVTAYVAWGSNDAPQRTPPVTFGAGAIASSFMSSDARTLAAPPQDWKPGSWNDTQRYFAGSPEALAADWLAAGLTGLGSQVAEPYMDGAFRPGTLIEAWVRGYTLAEAYYLATPYLSWQSVVFGDPLARATDSPYATEPESESPPETFLTTRAAAVLRHRQPALSEAASLLMARANLSIARGETVEARALMEQVIVAAPRYAAGHLALGQLYETSQQHDLARARYEAVLQLEPANVVALNNLAYSVGVHAQRPKEALAMAERAAALGSNSPSVLDTLGWIRHLAGNSRGALDPLRRAVQGDAGLCEAWRHLAVVERAVGHASAADKAEERARACEPAAQRQ